MADLYATTCSAWIIPHGRTVDDDAAMPAAATAIPYDDIAWHSQTVGNRVPEIGEATGCH